MIRTHTHTRLLLEKFVKKILGPSFKACVLKKKEKRIHCMLASFVESHSAILFHSTVTSHTVENKHANLCVVMATQQAGCGGQESLFSHALAPV